MARDMMNRHQNLPSAVSNIRRPAITRDTEAARPSDATGEINRNISRGAPGLPPENSRDR